MGLAHRPDWAVEEEESAELSGPEWAKHAHEVFTGAFGSGGYQEADVQRTAKAILDGWQSNGQRVAPTRATAQKLAYATGNSLAGFTGRGHGAAVMFGASWPEGEEEAASGTGADLEAVQKQMGLR